MPPGRPISGWTHWIIQRNDHRVCKSCISRPPARRGASNLRFLMPMLQNRQLPRLEARQTVRRGPNIKISDFWRFVPPHAVHADHCAHSYIVPIGVKGTGIHRRVTPQGFDNAPFCKKVPHLVRQQQDPPGRPKTCSIKPVLPVGRHITLGMSLMGITTPGRTAQLAASSPPQSVERHVATKYSTSGKRQSPRQRVSACLKVRFAQLRGYLGPFTAPSVFCHEGPMVAARFVDWFTRTTCSSAGLGQFGHNAFAGSIRRRWRANFSGRTRFQWAWAVLIRKQSYASTVPRRSAGSLSSQG